MLLSINGLREYVGLVMYRPPTDGHITYALISSPSLKPSSSVSASLGLAPYSSSLPLLRPSESLSSSASAIPSSSVSSSCGSLPHRNSYRLPRPSPSESPSDPLSPASSLTPRPIAFSHQSGSPSPSASLIASAAIGVFVATITAVPRSVPALYQASCQSPGATPKSSTWPWLQLVTPLVKFVVATS